MKIAALTGRDNYFEDFKVGSVIEHWRGKTVGELENVGITNIVMNTAQVHFNEDIGARDPNRKGRVVYGGVTMSIVIGLASQDTSENALADLGLDKIRFPTMVSHGDTLYAYSEVLEAKDADQPDAGIVRFKHWGVNQKRELVFEGERIVLVKRRSHWGER
jgi:acyl dehydratase